MSDHQVIFRREVREDDLAAIRRIVESTGVFSPVEIDVAVELVDDRLRRGAASDYEFLFAELDGRVAGYACFGPIALTAFSYDLYWIAVERSLHGRHIGRILLDEAEEAIRRRGGQRVYAETSGRDQYAPTRGFYLRQGYRQDALLEDFYAPGDDKVIYAKVLTPLVP